VDSVSFALGIVSNVTEPGDHGYEAVQRNTGSNGSAATRKSGTRTRPAARKPSATRRKSSGTARVISGDTWQTASDGAASHRRFYRGHDLTAAFDSGEFSKNVADGSFRDIFPGDYIRKKITVPAVANLKTSTYDVKFIIADLDIAMDQGTPRVTAHHAIIVPEEPVFYTYMNPSDTNAGGYAESYMHKTVMPAFSKGLTGAFGEKHLLKSSFDGAGNTSSDPLVCTCRLMTLSMVFGRTPPWYYSCSWSDFDKDNCLDGKRLAAFSIHSDIQSNGIWYWLSDTLSSSSFADAYADSSGVDAHAVGASAHKGGVRPFALLA